MANLTNRIVKWGYYGVKHHGSFTYSESADRMNSIGTKPGTLPVTCDCSAFVTLCYKWAGAKDPNGLAYNHTGYTGTELSHDQHIALWIKNNKGVKIEEVRPGDLVVYGPGTGLHVALVVHPGNGDPVTISMGKNGDPSVVRVSQDGRLPQTYLRCNTQGPGFIKRVVKRLVAPIQVKPLGR